MYLDANAGLPATETALTAYAEAVEELPHRAPEILRASQSAVLQTLGRTIGEDVLDASITFTGSGTQAIALGVATLLEKTTSDGRNTVVTSVLEHPAVLRNLEHHREEGRIELVQVPASRAGVVDLEKLSDAIDSKTALVAIMGASNETGVIQPIRKIAQLAHAAGARLFVDAVQMPGKASLDEVVAHADAFALSGHKFGSLGGVGALITKYDVTPAHALSAWLPETEHNAFTNVAGAKSFSAALEEAASLWPPQLRDAFEEQLRGSIDDIEIIGAMSPRLSNTSTVRFGGCRADILMMALDVRGICVSTGSACSSGSIEPSDALLGMGFSNEEAKQALRFSFHPAITTSELEAIVTETVDVIDRARKIAP